MFDAKPEEYKFEPHNFKKIRGLSWNVCSNCGLLALNNRFSLWAIDKGCNNTYHPSYKNARAKYTKLF